VLNKSKTYSHCRFHLERLIDDYMKFIHTWENFTKMYTSETDFLTYISYKIKELEKDFISLRRHKMASLDDE